MKPFLQLLAVTTVTWIIHVVLVTGYSRLISDSHGLPFRIIYALELTGVFSTAVWLYLMHAKPVPSSVIVVLTVIGFLAVVDLLLSLYVASVRNTFDVWHFVAAYTLLAGSLMILYKRFVNPS